MFRAEFKDMTLDPIDAINNIESLINVGTLLNLTEHHHELGVQILGLVHDYVLAIKENREASNDQ